MKKKVTITVTPVVWVRGRDLAWASRKSMSQFVEDLILAAETNDNKSKSGVIGGNEVSDDAT